MKLKLKHVGLAAAALLTAGAAATVTYAIVPHSVIHRPVAAAPPATLDDHIKALDRALGALDPTQVENLQHRLHQAGYTREVRTPGFVTTDERVDVNVILRKLSQGATPPTPAAFDRGLRQLQVAHMASASRLLRPQVHTETRTEIVSCVDAGAALQASEYSRLGRNISPAEQARFCAWLRARSTYTTTVTRTPAVDADGLPLYKNDIQQFATTDTRGTAPPSLEASAYAFASEDPEMRAAEQSYRFLQYWNALPKAIAAPV